MTTSAAVELLVVTADGLRLREKPQTTSLIVRKLRRGAQVRAFERSKDRLWTWVEVRADSDERASGWLASKYLAPLDHPVASSGMHEEPWMIAALHELGVKQVLGPGNSARVLMYLESTDLDRTMAGTDETPWCSAFVNWCFEVSGHGGTNSAAARSWLGWGVGVTKPRRGVVTVLKRDGGGHVGFWLGQTAKRVTLLGGNQGDQVCVAEYDALRILGHRAPG